MGFIAQILTCLTTFKNWYLLRDGTLHVTYRDRILFEVFFIVYFLIYDLKTEKSTISKVLKITLNFYT